LDDQARSSGKKRRGDSIPNNFQNDDVKEKDKKGE
jgi:hypothetical protein